MPKDRPFHSPSEQWVKLKPLAREMRHKPTLAENYLWERLRDRRCDGIKFRRQYSIGPFIVDFFCPAANLVIEIDGSIHEIREPEDQARQAFLEAHGLHVIRFTNDDVLHNLDDMVTRIIDVLKQR